MNSFLLQLSKKESLLQRSFFKTPSGDDDDEVKIAFVWARLPEAYRRELQRAGPLEAIRTWEDFERAVRNAETAVAPDPSAKAHRGVPEDSTSKGKRQASQSGSRSFGKKQDRKLSNPNIYSRRTSPARDDRNPSGDRQQSNLPDKNRGYQNNYQRGHQKPHWKNKRDGDDNSRREDNRHNDKAGKDKPQ